MAGRSAAPKSQIRGACRGFTAISLTQSRGSSPGTCRARPSWRRPVEPSQTAPGVLQWADVSKGLRFWMVSDHGVGLQLCPQHSDRSAGYHPPGARQVVLRHRVRSGRRQCQGEAEALAQVRRDIVRMLGTNLTTVQIGLDPILTEGESIHTGPLTRPRDPARERPASAAVMM